MRFINIMKTFKNIFLVAFIGLLISWSINLNAQYDLGIYNMRLVPQTNLSNPAFIPDYQYHFGFPGLSSIHAGFGTSGARYNQIFEITSDDSLGLNSSGFLDALKDGNNINFRSTQQWLNGGMKWQDFYFSVSISDIVDVNSYYSKNLVSLALLGNGEHIGETVNLDPVALKALHYREYALGAAYDFNDQWNFGVKAKLLFGKSAVNTEKMDFGITTSKDYYYIDVKSNFLVNTSITANKKDSGDVSWSEYEFYGSNFGLGFDLGATFKLDDTWSFSASVLDLGYIQYDRYLKTYSSEAEFTYKGIGVNQFDGLNDYQQEQKWIEIKDSLIDLLDVNEETSKFIVPLTAKVYLGANYKLSDKETIGALARIEIFKGKIRPSFTASYYRQIDEHFGVTANYSIINRSYFNLGLGAVVNFEPIQFYVVTDNIVGLIAPDMVRYANFHVGINFIFPDTKVNHPMINL